MPISVARRNQLVVLRNTGHTNKDVIRYFAEKLNMKVDRRTVQRVYKKYRTTGSVEDVSRSGRPKKCEGRLARRLLRIELRDRFASIPAGTAELNNSSDVKVSRDTVRRTLKLMGLRRRVARRRPCLSAGQRRQRLAFSSDFLAHLLVTRSVSEKFSQKCTTGVQKEGPQIHIWGCIGWPEVGRLVRIHGTPNIVLYMTNICIGRTYLNP